MVDDICQTPKLITVQCLYEVEFYEILADNRAGLKKLVFINPNPAVFGVLLSCGSI